MTKSKKGKRTSSLLNGWLMIEYKNKVKGFSPKDDYVSNVKFGEVVECGENFSPLRDFGFEFDEEMKVDVGDIVVFKRNSDVQINDSTAFLKRRNIIKIIKR